MKNVKKFWEIFICMDGYKALNFKGLIWVHDTNKFMLRWAQATYVKGMKIRLRIN